jgi:hypothetical protein
VIRIARLHSTCARQDHCDLHAFINAFAARTPRQPLMRLDGVMLRTILRTPFGPLVEEFCHGPLEFGTHHTMSGSGTLRCPRNHLAEFTRPRADGMLTGAPFPECPVTRRRSTAANLVAPRRVWAGTRGPTSLGHARAQLLDWANKVSCLGGMVLPSPSMHEQVLHKMFEF